MGGERDLAIMAGDALVVVGLAAQVDILLFDGEVTELICLYKTRPSTSTTTLSATITTAWNGNSMELTTTSSGVERPKRFVSQSSTV